MRIPWREVEPLPKINGALEPRLATVDALRSAWEEALGRASPEEFVEARQRSLRRHAIETGIIERLYDLDWGVTEALVAEGITAEVAGREGGVSDDALRLIRDQLNAAEPDRHGDHSSDRRREHPMSRGRGADRPYARRRRGRVRPTSRQVRRRRGCGGG